MYLVMEKILELQKDFFMFGPQNLKPLTLNDVAEEVGMHMSTISRVTRDKYVDTPWGIFELKYFFTNSIKNESGNIKAAQSVKEIIKQIIEHETTDKKLSDQKISDILTNQGIQISRRTVAKYRKNLKILSSYDRKI
jgi:RNA polymerase sigma-54 factor